MLQMLSRPDEWRTGIRGVGKQKIPSLEGCRVSGGVGLGIPAGPGQPTPAFGHPSKEGRGRSRSLLPQNGRVVSPWRERGLAVLLAGGLSLVAAGCAVLPIALQRPLPSTGMALRSMETAQERLAEMQDSAANQFEAASVTQPGAVHGAPQAAYRRWVDDEVRELPSPASTVAIMGGTQ